MAIGVFEETYHRVLFYLLHLSIIGAFATIGLMYIYGIENLIWVVVGYTLCGPFPILLVFFKPVPPPPKTPMELAHEIVEGWRKQGLMK